MCRWLAYAGPPVLLTQVLHTPVHSLIDQSLIPASRNGASPARAVAATLWP